MDELQDSRFLGVANEITIITPIKQGRIPGSSVTFKDKLAGVLSSIYRRELSGIPTPIRLIDTIHFARWIIWNDGDTDQLIFTSNYDGSMWQYLRDFSNLIADDLDRVWSNCVGYPQGGCHDFDAFWQYVLEHQVETSAFYAAMPTQSLINRQSLQTFKRNFDVFLSQQWDCLKAEASDRDAFVSAFKQFVLDNQSYL